jgi:hypothetical protein
MRKHTYATQCSVLPIFLFGLETPKGDLFQLTGNKHSAILFVEICRVPRSI